MRSLINNQEKTSFSRSAIFSLIEAFVPGVLIWIILGKDIKVLSITISLQWQIIASIILLIWAILSTLIFYKLQFTNFDQFGFSIPIAIILIIIFLTSFYDLNIWIRLAICFAGIFISTIGINLLIYIPNKFSKHLQN